jgi:hypothetical protein
MIKIEPAPHKACPSGRAAQLRMEAKTPLAATDGQPSDRIWDCQINRLAFGVRYAIFGYCGLITIK